MNSTAADRKVVVVTGASSGIGKETAKAFAAMGWHVIGTGRNAERSAAAEAEIRAAAAPEARVDFVRGDMALMAETKRIADEIKGLTGRIDVLINNAGGVRDQRYVTSEGTEETFSANHLAPFLLTRELLPLLRAAVTAEGSARVLAVSSQAYAYTTSMNWEDLQNLEGEFAASGVYCQAKLANQLFNVELDRRVAEEGIVSQALVPGPVATNFFTHGDQTMQEYGKVADAMTPQDVAQTLVWMATAPETGLPGGRMFYDHAEVERLPQGTDTEQSARLWRESEALLEKLGF